LAKYVIPAYCRVKGYYLPSTADVLHFAGHGEAEFGKSHVSRILMQGRVLNTSIIASRSMKAQ